MMNRSPFMLFCVMTFAIAQVPTAAIKPPVSSSPERSSSSSEKPKRITSVSAPILGYVLGPGATELHAVLATRTSAKLEPVLQVPPGSSRLYLPPRQLYALSESKNNDPIAVWALHRQISSGIPQEPVSLPGAMPHPDLLGFSPLGEAAILYSQVRGTFQIISHLHANSLLSDQPVSIFAKISKLSISDDGELVVVELADGRVMSSLRGSPWQVVPSRMMLAVWSLIPNSHSLVISDSSQRVITILANLEGTWQDFTVLAAGIQADLLAFTKDGKQLIAAEQSTNKLWILNLKTSELVPNESDKKIDTLISLRQGFTFLLSQPPGIAIMRVAPKSEANSHASDSTLEQPSPIKEEL